MNWIDFYKQRVNSSYQDYFNNRYEPFLDVVKKLSNHNGIFELGCGIGSVSKAIGGKFEGIDINPQMVDLANLNTGTNAFHTQNIFDVVVPNQVLKVSHGVLEHFSDAEICEICERFPNSIHYVPLDKYETPSFGDERLLSYKHWIDLVTPKYWMLFNNDHDLMFII